MTNSEKRPHDVLERLRVTTRWLGPNAFNEFMTLPPREQMEFLFRSSAQAVVDLESIMRQTKSAISQALGIAGDMRSLMERMDQIALRFSITKSDDAAPGVIKMHDTLAAMFERGSANDDGSITLDHAQLEQVFQTKLPAGMTATMTLVDKKKLS